jgi:hypothetical protein
VSRQGVVLPVPLTHAQLAEMIGAQRPSTTVALGRLRAKGVLSPLPGRRWVLHGEAPTGLTSRRRGGAALPLVAPSGTNGELGGVPAVIGSLDDSLVGGAVSAPAE